PAAKRPGRSSSSASIRAVAISWRPRSMAIERRARELIGIVAFALVVVACALFVAPSRRVAASSVARPRAARGAVTVSELPAVLPTPVLPESLTVGIVHDPSSDGYLSRGAMDSIVERWGSELATIGATVRVLTPRDAAAAMDVRVLLV